MQKVRKDFKLRANRIRHFREFPGSCEAFSLTANVECVNLDGTSEAFSGINLLVKLLCSEAFPSTHDILTRLVLYCKMQVQTLHWMSPIAPKRVRLMSLVTVSL